MFGPLSVARSAEEISRSNWWYGWRCGRMKFHGSRVQTYTRWWWGSRQRPRCDALSQGAYDNFGSTWWGERISKAISRAMRVEQLDQDADLGPDDRTAQWTDIYTNSQADIWWDHGVMGWCELSVERLNLLRQRSQIWNVTRVLKNSGSMIRKQYS